MKIIEVFMKKTTRDIEFFYATTILLFYMFFLSNISMAQETILYKNTPIDVEYVNIKTHDNTSLTGYVFIPSHQSNLPAVIIHHGFGNGAKENFYLTPKTYSKGLQSMPLAEELAKAGFISFVYDQRGTGESGGKFSIESRISDIEYILQYIKKVPYINPNKIGIFGHSLGAYISSVAAAIYKDFKAATLWSTPSSFEYILNELLENRGDSENVINITYDTLYNTSVNILYNFPRGVVGNFSGLLYIPNILINDTLQYVLENINYQSTLSLALNNIGFVPDVGIGISKEEGAYIVLGKMRTSIYDLLKTVEISKTINPELYIDKISPRPLLLVHGTEDDVVPLKSSEYLYTIAKDPKEFIIIENTDHNYRGPEDKRNEAINYTVNWFIKNLK
jgi:dipeptidyl aminopeptidase/acylaminoacyl peptidase